MKRAYCTVVTSDYIPYARVLATSLLVYDNTPLYVFVSDYHHEINSKDNLIQLLGPDNVKDTFLAKEIQEKYALSDDSSHYRWAMKPVLMNYLLNSAGYDKVMFLDADLCFFESPNFLFDELEKSSFLLTPHWRNPEPIATNENFNCLYNEGLYNAGFVAASVKSTEILNWWSKACLFSTEIIRAKGMFGDQAHLNLIPVYFENVQIVRHQGCNVSNWNLDYCERQNSPQGVLINGKHPIVFIHFTKSTIKGIVRGKDPLLLPYLERYIALLGNEGIQLDLDRLVAPISVDNGSNKGGIRSLFKKKNNH